jgi:transposase-like protein
LADYLDTARKAIEDQLANLRQEVQRLERVAHDLAGGTARRRPGRPRGSGGRRKTATAKATAKKSTATRARRTRRGGTRADQALTLVKNQPGVTIPELARKMGIKQNYLYRVMPQLQKEKKVTKKGKGWHPA